MKQNKYREQLQKRRVTPSNGAWEHLEKKLDAHENKEKKGASWFLKVASIVLILISVSYYYLTPEKQVDNTPVIAAPSIKKKMINHSEKNEVIQSGITNRNDISPIAVKETDHSNIAVSKKAGIPSIASLDNGNTLSDNLIELSINDSISGLIEVAEISISKEELIDEEVEQLLRNSKIKLVVNGQIASKKTVSSEALLNSVEEDLYKDLKQKLIEKITSKLNNPKEVVTSREN